ncbi:MAG: PAS domain-containing protein [Verrucomicrobia bacterium]|nr:MAG: PAS domain-containing protein [Verrucomicrobiota bacterium]TAE86648.1 MAG: PAS domain-containing protein [Verrucomicrobiota bacterium]TAF24427.1 MAG: PAS domain-containing protein [Verrucomicrobiota bacterium]TAF39988.1 MAG: PAS domain-containing protein [Verrucomicrobiota bacterium]
MKPGFLDKLLARLDRIDPAEARQLLDRLVREKGFLEQVFEALHEGVIVLDEAGGITFINGAACRFFGIDPEQATGSILTSKIPGLDWTSLAKPGTSVSRDLEIFYPENRYLNFYLSPIQPEDPSGATVGWVMLVRDLTTTRQEAEQTLESERLNALTLLAAGVAHEIGNPLNSLDIHLQLLARKLRKLPPGDRGPLEDHLHTARNEIQRLDTILKQFLQAIRPSTPNRERCDLTAVLRDALRLLEPELESREIAVELDLDANFPRMELDAGQFQQVFYNLLRNAFQAIGSGGGVIRLGAHANDFEATLSIEDNGTGIPPEQMGSLFEPYRTTKQNGTGLGLLIVRRVVREHGGEIEIQSEAGAGTRILIHLPRGPKPVRLLEPPLSIIDID